MLAQEKNIKNIFDKCSGRVEDISIDLTVKSAAWFLLRRQVPFDHVINCISYELKTKSPKDVIKSIPCEYTKEFLNLREEYNSDYKIFYEHFDIKRKNCSELDYLINKYMAKH